MTIILTMAGAGSRFARAGYREPKYAIPFRGHTLLEWSLVSLWRFTDHPLVVVTQPHDEVADLVRGVATGLGFSRLEIVFTEGLTRGQAESALLAAQSLDRDAPAVIYNTDTFIRPDALDPMSISGDGWIPCFPAAGDKWSFVDVDESGAAKRVTEKVRISDHCSVGLYYFSSFELFADAAAADATLTAGERYVAPLYNTLIQDGRRVEIQQLASADVCVLGTPEDLAVASPGLAFPTLP